MCKSRALLYLDTNKLHKKIMALLIPSLFMPLLRGFDRLKVPTMGHLIEKGKGLPWKVAFDNFCQVQRIDWIIGSY